MGILDWFINRSAQFDPDKPTEEILAKAIDKAVTLTNPRLRLVEGYREKLRGSVSRSIDYFREKLSDLPEEIDVSAANWANEPVLRAFFARPEDLIDTVGRSRNLRTFFGKYPTCDRACVVLETAYNERLIEGVALQGDAIRPDPAQVVVDFSAPRIRICGHTIQEVKSLLGAQSFEYLVAQAMAEISELRSEVQELQENCNLIRARLRLLRQQGPGLGTVFDAAPENAEQRRLESQLVENELQLEKFGTPRDVLDNELNVLCSVLDEPERYLRLERKRLYLSPLNVVLDDSASGDALKVEFMIAVLSGIQKNRRAFVAGSVRHAELPPMKLDIENAERFL